jgi:hypothetical protein
VRATCKSLSRSVITGSSRILESFSLFVAQILLSLYFHLVINNLPMLPILIRSHIIMSCRFHIKTICDRINILVTKGKHFLTRLKNTTRATYAPQKVQIIQAFLKSPQWRFEKITCRLLTLLIFFISVSERLRILLPFDMAKL